MNTLIVISLALVWAVANTAPSGVGGFGGGAPQDGDPQITDSVIDILSNNVEFSTYLRVLQRKGYVPMLNELQNFTLIAPVNSAFAKVDTIPDGFGAYIIDNSVVHLADYEELNSKIFNTSDGSPILLQWSHEYRNWQIGGSEIVEEGLFANSQNAIVHGVDTMLDTYHRTCDLFRQQLSIRNDTSGLDDFKTFSKLILSNGCDKVTNVTGLIPVDSSLSFNEVEMSYLQHPKIGKADRDLYIRSHLVSGFVGGNLSVETSDLAGSNLSLLTDVSGKLTVDGKHTAQVSNYLASDGVLHFFDSDIKNPIDFTTRKYLHGLNVSSFVEELDFRSLGHLIDDKDLEQTIFVNLNDDEDETGQNLLTSIGVKSANKNNDLYQFAKGTVDLTDDALLDSKYCFKKLGGNCQKIKVTKIDPHRFILNNHVLVDPRKNYQVGNTKIYLIDDSLMPPARLDLSIGPYYHASRSMKYLNNLDLISLPNNNQGYTFMIPDNDSWEELELTWTYLLHNTTALDVLMQSTIINGLVYSDFEGSLETTSLDGYPLTVNKSGEVVSLDGTKFKIKENSDILFSQGVAHTLDRVIFPSDLVITLTNLLDSTKNVLFKEFLEFSRLLSLLEDEHYSLILPTESSLHRQNITLDFAQMNELLRLHIIPQESVQALLDCDANAKISTSLNETNLACRELTPGVRMLQIIEGNDKEVRVLTKGCTSGPTQQCLFVVDRPIDPDWIDKPFNGIPHIKLPFVAMGIGAILCLVGVILVLSCLLVFCVGRNKPDDFDEEDITSDDEHNGLLNRSSASSAARHQGVNYGTIGANNTNNNNIGSVLDFAETSYSDNAKSQAVDVKAPHNKLTDQDHAAPVKKNFW